MLTALPLGVISAWVIGWQYSCSYRSRGAFDVLYTAPQVNGICATLGAGVAAAHSHHLTSSRAVTQHVMDAVDVIVGSPRALPKPLEAMLFQSAAPGMQAPPDTHDRRCNLTPRRCALLI